MPADEARKKVLDEATAMFLHEGYQKTNLDTLAQMLFMSKRTIYKMFGSKKELYKECIKGIVESTTNYDEETFSHKKRSVVNIRDFIAGHSTGEMIVMEQALNDVQKYFPDIYEECLKKSEQRRMVHIIKQVKEGQERGEIQEGVNPEMVAILVQEMIRARIRPNETLDNPPLPYLRSEIYLEMVRIFLRGLLSQDKIKEYDENIT